MAISEEERRQWYEGARRAAELQVERLVQAYGLKPSDDLRRAFRWIAYNAPIDDVRAVAEAFEEVSGSSFIDGYRDGLDSAALTDDEREAHENDLGLNEDEDQEDEK